MTTSDFRDPQVTVDGGVGCCAAPRTSYELMLDFEGHALRRSIRRNERSAKACSDSCLLRDNLIAGYIELPKPGSFAVMFIPPRSGRHRLQVTHGTPPIG